MESMISHNFVINQWVIRLRRDLPAAKLLRSFHLPPGKTGVSLRLIICKKFLCRVPDMSR
jgi:hypothetical protein